MLIVSNDTRSAVLSREPEAPPRTNHAESEPGS